jgi:hypothetical protein
MQKGIDAFFGKRQIAIDEVTCHWYSSYLGAESSGFTEGWRHMGECDAGNGKLLHENRLACKDFGQESA